MLSDSESAAVTVSVHAAALGSGELADVGELGYAVVSSIDATVPSKQYYEAIKFVKDGPSVIATKAPVVGF